MHIKYTIILRKCQIGLSLLLYSLLLYSKRERNNLSQIYLNTINSDNILYAYIYNLFNNI